MNFLKKYIFQIVIITFNLCILLSIFVKDVRFDKNMANFATPSFAPPHALNLNKQDFSAFNNLIKTLGTNTQISEIPNQELSAHSSAMVDLGERIMMLFFAGSEEGAPDVKIYQSFMDKKTCTWEKPNVILSREMLHKMSGKYIKKLGNPIIFKDVKNRLHVFVNAVSIGGWAGSRIYQFRLDSKNLHNLIFVRELKLSSFFNFSHLVRTPSLNTEDGGFVLPFYHEMIKKYSLIGFFDADGNFIRKKIIERKNTLQPSIVALDSTSCIGIFRHYIKAYSILKKCTDKANSWEEEKISNITNANFSPLLIKLNNEVLLISNDGDFNPLLELLSFSNINSPPPHNPRSSLSLFWLNEGNFVRLLTLDAVLDNNEVSYPSSVQDAENLYISYTYKREKIRSLVLNKNLILAIIYAHKNNIPIKLQELENLVDENKSYKQLLIDDVIL